MIPKFNGSGNLPKGIHWTNWKEFEERFGTNPHRKRLLKGLKQAAANLRAAGCEALYVDGSFVTSKERPNDFDACWSGFDVDGDLLDPVLLDFSNGRAAQKAKFGGELFPAEWLEGNSGKSFLEFFQDDRKTDKQKGIVGIRLGRASPGKRT
ncbi:MAG: hypothetical protein HYR56_01035 [Acidobacteria bacterium]|nr:hypothetical protein [Acidobacteriota bacterium]MBI3426924.1 hypothetical protein [Acidobacteriota bacterium]